MDINDYKSESNFNLKNKIKNFSENTKLNHDLEMIVLELEKQNSDLIEIFNCLNEFILQCEKNAFYDIFVELDLPSILMNFLYYDQYEIIVLKIIYNTLQNSNKLLNIYLNNNIFNYIEKKLNMPIIESTGYVLKVYNIIFSINNELIIPFDIIYNLFNQYYDIILNIKRKSRKTVFVYPFNEFCIEFAKYCHNFIPHISEISETRQIIDCAHKVMKKLLKSTNIMINVICEMLNRDLIILDDVYKFYDEIMNILKTSFSDNVLSVSNLFSSMVNKEWEIDEYTTELLLSCIDKNSDNSPVIYAILKLFNQILNTDRFKSQFHEILINLNAYRTFSRLVVRNENEYLAHKEVKMRKSNYITYEQSSSLLINLYEMAIHSEKISMLSDKSFIISLMELLNHPSTAVRIKIFDFLKFAFAEIDGFSETFDEIGGPEKMIDFDYDEEEDLAAYNAFVDTITN